MRRTTWSARVSGRSGRRAVLAIGLVLLAVGALVWRSGPGATAEASQVAIDGGLLVWQVDADRPAAARALTSDREAVCGGIGTPCIALTGSRSGTVPAGCAQDGGDGFYARCSLRDVTRVEITGTGGLPFETAVDRDADSACPTAAVVVHQSASNGGTDVDDGCPQTVECEIAYVGTVRVDATDTVSPGCTTIERDGKVTSTVENRPCTLANGCADTKGGGSSQPGTSSPPPSTFDGRHRPPGSASADPKTGSTTIGPSRLARRGRRHVVTFPLTFARECTVGVQRRASRGRRRWVDVASGSVTRKCRAGTNRITLPRRALRATGRYRVVVAAATAMNVRFTNVVVVR